MKAIKYMVRKETFEFNPRKNTDIEEAFFNMRDHASMQIALCDSIEEARSILENIEVETISFSESLSRATVAYIEAAEFEKEGNSGEWEFVSGSDYWDLKFKA